MFLRSQIKQILNRKHRKFEILYSLKLKGNNSIKNLNNSTVAKIVAYLGKG